MASHSYLAKGGVTSSSGHRQRFHQMKSPGSNTSQTSSPRRQPVPSQQQPSGMNFMIKQNSQVRQDDSVLMRPNTTNNRALPQGAGFQEQSTLRNAVMAQQYNRGVALNQSVAKRAVMIGNFMDNGGDLHDCTHEEQMDEFDMVDQEEIFDECDEQTGISRHQMNIGLSRHPKNSSELFNVFNRSHGAVTTELQMQHNLSSKALMERHLQRSSAMQSCQQEERKAKDRQSYNDFLRSQSPQMHQRSREGSRSPPALAHFQKEAFFGSSFAGNAVNSGHKRDSGMVANTFALSSVNRMQVARHSNQSLAQDKGPQNFKKIEIGQHQIPDQFQADLSKVNDESSDNMETSFQQDEGEDEFSSSFIARNENVDQHLLTEQDTIIDQDDDVAEECPKVDDLNQQTQAVDGGSIYRFMGEKRHAGDMQIAQDADFKRGSVNRSHLTNHSSGLSQRGLFAHHQSQPSHPLIGGQQVSSYPNILLASQNSTMSANNQAIRGSLANKPRTNLVGVGPKQGMHGGVTSKPMIHMHSISGQNLQDTRSLSRFSKTSGPSMADMTTKPQPQIQKDAICETVEDIQESVVITQMQNAALNDQNFQNGRSTLTKRDNKDCKKVNGDISIGDLHQPSNVRDSEQSNVKNGFKNMSSFKATENSQRSPEQVMIDFRHGTFRSPKASPPPTKTLLSTNKGSSAVQAAESSMKKKMLKNQQFFLKQQTEDVDGLQQNFFEEKADTVPLRTQQAQEPETASLQQQQLQVDDSVHLQKTNAELQREYLDLLQQVKQTQTHKQSMLTTVGNQPAQLNQNRKKSRQFFDENASEHSMLSKAKSSKNQSAILPLGSNRGNGKQTHNSSISELPMQHQIEQKRIVRNVVSTRLTPKSSHGAADDISDRGISAKRNLGGPGYHVNVGSTSGKLRQVRLSARPAGSARLDHEERHLMSPQVKSDSQMVVQGFMKKNRRSPIPSSGMANDTLLAKNLSIQKSNNSRYRLRNARTFVIEDKKLGTYNDAVSQHSKHSKYSKSRVKNRSMITSSSVQENIAAKSFRKSSTSKLQALAELRERENQTVQNGQLHLGRQRSREGYFEHITAAAKSTQDRLIGQDTDRQYEQASLQRGEIPPHIINQTETTDKQGHYRQGTFERNLDSIEGLTVEDDQASLQEEEDVDVLSRSQSNSGQDEDYGTSDEDDQRRAFRPKRANGRHFKHSYEADEDDAEDDYCEEDDEYEDYYGSEEDGRHPQDQTDEHYSSEDESYYEESHRRSGKNHKRKPTVQYRESLSDDEAENDHHLGKRNDSRKRQSYNPNSRQRQKSPLDSRSNYSRKRQSNRHSARKPDQNQQRDRRSRQGAPPVHPQRQNRGNLNRNQSNHDLPNDRHMKTHLSKVQPGKRNQPHKININMTDSSNNNNTGGYPQKMDTAQSLNSQQQFAQQPQHPQIIPGHQGYMMPQGAPLPQNNYMFYPQAVPQTQDNTHLLMLHQQALFNQMAQSQGYMTGLNPMTQQAPFNQGFNGLLQPQQQALSNPMSPQVQNSSLQGHSAQQLDQGLLTQSAYKQPDPVSQEVSMISPNDKKNLLEETTDNQAGISWLQNNSQSRIQEEAKKEYLSPISADDGKSKATAPIADDDQDFDNLWKKLKEKEQEKKSQDKEAFAIPGQSDSPPLRTQKEEPKQEEDEVENFMVTKPKKKAEAIIIGFDEPAAPVQARNPFANRSKRPPMPQAKDVKPRGSIKGKKGAKLDDSNDQVPEKIVPLGTDFKKISIEQIQAREERLKRIKDQGLIEVSIDDGGSNETQDLAAAFLAKRRARMAGGDKQPQQALDQDLAVANDAPVVKPVEKVRKTPKELAELRKAMMKKRHQPQEVVVEVTPARATPQAEPVATGKVTSVKQTLRTKSSTSKLSVASKEPSAALMERLAGGKRTQIDKKEMKKLTKSKFENLPEIKRRKDEERKRQEALEKKERIAKYNKECKARSRAQLKKKRESAVSVAESTKTTVVTTQISLVPTAAQAQQRDDQ